MAFPDLTYITNESFQMNMTFIQINAAQNGGKDCEGDAKEVKACNEQDCPPIPARSIFVFFTLQINLL